MKSIKETKIVEKGKISLGKYTCLTKFEFETRLPEEALIELENKDHGKAAL